MIWSLTNVYSLLEGLAVHTTKMVNARMRRWGMVPSTRDSLLRPWFWSAQRCWISSSTKLSRRKLLRFCGYSQKSPHKVYFHQIAGRFLSQMFPAIYTVLQLNIIHTDGPICGPIVNIIGSRAALLVSQATPFAERGRVWSHCNYRVVAEECSYGTIEHSSNKMLTSS